MTAVYSFFMPRFYYSASKPPNILDEPQAKVALPLLFFLQGE
jgi:hypothetical protein